MDKEGSFIFYDSNYLQESFSSFQDMRMKGEYIDIMIKAGNTLFPAHRVVLAARFPHFRKILSNQDKVVSFTNIDSDILNSIINFAYEGKLKVSSTKVQSMLFAAVHLHLDKVQNACLEFEAKRFNSNKEVRTIKLIPSDTNIRNNFDEYYTSDEFLLLPYYSLKELISRDDLIVANENKVVEAVMKWTKASPMERRHRLPYLLSEIRLNYLSPEFLVEKVVNEVLIKTSKQCRHIVEEAKSYHLLKKRSMSLSFKTAPRVYTDNTHENITCDLNSSVTKSQFDLDNTTNNTVGSRSGNTLALSSKRVPRLHMRANIIHDINTNKSINQRDLLNTDNDNTLVSKSVSGSTSINTTPLSFKRVPRVHMRGYTSETISQCDLDNNTDNAVVSASGSCTTAESTISENVTSGIYAVHSFPSVGTFVSCYDYPHRKWNNFSSNSSSEFPLQVVAICEKLYVFFLKSIEVFDLLTLKWHTVGRLPITTENSGIVCHDNRIYIFGGLELPEIIRCLDTKLNFWLQDEAMKIPCHSMSVVSYSPLESHIYLTGGYNTSCSNAFLKFDPIMKTWIDMPSMIYYRMDHASAVLNEKLYVCGGRNNHAEFLETAEIYDEVSKQWDFISYLKTPRYLHSMVTWDSKLHVFGGVSKQEVCSSDAEVYDYQANEWMLGVVFPPHNNRIDDDSTECFPSEKNVVVNLKVTAVTARRYEHKKFPTSDDPKTSESPSRS